MLSLSQPLARLFPWCTLHTGASHQTFELIHFMDKVTTGEFRTVKDIVNFVALRALRNPKFIGPERSVGHFTKYLRTSRRVVCSRTEIQVREN